MLLSVVVFIELSRIQLFTINAIKNDDGNQIVNISNTIFGNLAVSVINTYILDMYFNEIHRILLKVYAGHHFESLHCGPELRPLQFSGVH